MGKVTFLANSHCNDTFPTLSGAAHRPVCCRTKICFHADALQSKGLKLFFDKMEYVREQEHILRYEDVPASGLQGRDRDEAGFL